MGRDKNGQQRRSKARGGTPPCHHVAVPDEVRSRSRSHTRGRTPSRSPRMRRSRRRSPSRRSRRSRSTSRHPESREQLRRLNFKDRRLASKSRSRSPISGRSDRRSSNVDEVQSMFFKKFLNVMNNVRSSSDGDRFPVLNVVPEFNPHNKEQTIDSWIHKVDECSQIYGWNDRQVVHYAMPKLTGVAKTWYQGQPSLLHTWSEWKTLLRENFPTRENYADLLQEMLNKRVRYGDALDLYYYSKMNLLNRCEITGRRAVDCLLAGIDDRNVRVGGQSAGFTEPEQVLKFLKSIKLGNDKDNVDAGRARDRDRQNQNLSHLSVDKLIDKPASTTQKQGHSMTCYNCNEEGHPFFRCPKPKLHCTNCRLLGHVSADCPKLKQNVSLEEKK